jgi:hypothetical protein
METVFVYAPYLTIGAYGWLISYLLLGGLRQNSQARHVHVIWFLALPTAVTVGLWFGARGVWERIYFFTLLADDENLSRAANVTATVLALVIPGIVFLRLMIGWAARRYRVMSLSGSLLVIALCFGQLTYEFIRGIDGWTAYGAAQNFFADSVSPDNPFIDPSATPRVVEEDLSAEYPGWAKGGWFVLYYGPARIQYVHVVRHGPCWWTVTGSGSLLPNWSIFGMAEKYWDSQREKQTVKLEAIISDYPNSEASRKAKAVLEELCARTF